MKAPSDSETWVIERGDALMLKKARSGLGGLSPWERLLYCFWVADYGMRNAGDLRAAHDLYAEFLSEGRRSAVELNLPLSRALFSLSQDNLEREYFLRFESVCLEIRCAEPDASPLNGGPTTGCGNPELGGGLQLVSTSFGESAMKYQLVLQFRERWPWSFHFLIRLEDQLITELGNSAVVDGHDCGSGEMNIFVYTDDPIGTFRKILPVLKRKLWVRVSVVAYREAQGQDYTVLWPDDSQKPFTIS